MPFKKGTSGSPKGSLSTTTKLISQAIDGNKMIANNNS